MLPEKRKFQGYVEEVPDIAMIRNPAKVEKQMQESHPKAFEVVDALAAVARKIHKLPGSKEDMEQAYGPLRTGMYGFYMQCLAT